MKLPLRNWKKLAIAFFFTAVAAFAANENGDSPFQGNRRPGILAEPSEVPTGENAKLTERMGKMPPNELLDLLSEDPKVSELRVKDLSSDRIRERPALPPADVD